MDRIILIGDVHGCKEELHELLDACSYSPKLDRLIFLGDLVDRGPDPVGVVQWIRRWANSKYGGSVQCVLGNHEEKHVRWAMHEQRRAMDSNYKNPMQPFSPERLEEHNRLSEDDKRWLASLPAYIRFEIGGQQYIATHAGVPTDKPIEQQDVRKLIRTRYVDTNGAYASSRDPRKVPEGAVPWYEKWVGPEIVVYGHQVNASVNYRPYSVGIDTGCCFGGTLTAMVLWPSGAVEYFCIQAKKAYKPLMLED